MNGTDLLAEFRQTGSDAAFRELVRRYTNLVYSVANRRLANPALAQEAAQLVFIRLARAVPKLRGDAELVAWLHRTTVHVAIDLWRSESRRCVREQHAAIMQPDSTENAAWEDIAPVLDEALNELADADREVILLRFFDKKNMRDLGAVFGVSEDAAKMRVSRAVERLRNQLSARGVGCGAGALAAVLADRAVEAAPSVVIAALMCLRIPVPVGVGGATRFFGALLNISRMKLLSGVAAVILVGVATFVLLRNPAPTNRIATPAQPPAVTPGGEGSKEAVASTTREVAPAGEAVEPDPLKLLQGAFQARKRIASGSMEFRVSVHNHNPSNQGTDEYRINALFDGPKRRFEQFVREYAYVGVGAAGEASRTKVEQQGLSREAAVRAGLLEGFDAHYVTAWDGEAVLQYRETSYESGRRSADATIDDPGKSPEIAFDPRCLGLDVALSQSGTIESLSDFYSESMSATLVGRERVEGADTWHVHFRSKHDDSLDFWIDAAHPSRVLKLSRARDVVISTFDDANPTDPIPTEINTVLHYSGGTGSAFLETRFVRSNTKYNVPIDPASWAHAGLGMAFRTPVVDIRIHRRIGYWTGIGLSEWPPPAKKAEETPTPPNRADLLAFLENDPSSHVALEAAAWILLNTPDGPDVEKAADVILHEHIRSPDLTYLSRELERVRHRCTHKLLEAMIEHNPSAEVKVNACFTLATLLKDEADYGQNRKATADAERYFQRVIAEAGRAGPKAADLARQAKLDLYALRNLIIGKLAPETEGEDLEGQPLKLSDYRGKVVVLSFWSTSTASDEADRRKLVERLAGKPFVLIGVNCDENPSKARAAIEKHEITWLTFWDRRDGPISTKWNVHSWLSVFVLDRNGVIRYRNLRSRELDAAVDALLAE